jgi:predicted PurR-regulated permease PerM
LRKLFLNSPSRLVWRIGVQLPAQLTIAAPAQPADQGALDAVTRLLHYVGLISQAVFALVAILLLSFYWIREGDRTVRSLLPLVPRDRRKGLAS